MSGGGGEGDDSNMTVSFWEQSHAAPKVDDNK